MLTVQEKLDKLAQMDPYEIAEFFEREGIKGVKGESCNCPVANYLSTSENEFLVDPDFVFKLGTEGYYHLMADTPQTVYEFMNRFDEGEYPKLEED